MSFSENSLRRQAYADCKFFMASHRASQGGSVSFFGSDRPKYSPLEVSRIELLETFFALHPQHEPFRDDITRLVRDPIITVARERWKETTSQLAAGRG